MDIIPFLIIDRCIEAEDVVPGRFDAEFEIGERFGLERSDIDRADIDQISDRELLTFTGEGPYFMELGMVEVGAEVLAALSPAGRERLHRLLWAENHHSNYQWVQDESAIPIERIRREMADDPNFFASFRALQQE